MKETHFQLCQELGVTDDLSLENERFRRIK